MGAGKGGRMNGKASPLTLKGTRCGASVGDAGICDDFVGVYTFGGIHCNFGVEGFTGDVKGVDACIMASDPSAVRSISPSSRSLSSSEPSRVCGEPDLGFPALPETRANMHEDCEFGNGESLVFRKSFFDVVEFPSGFVTIPVCGRAPGKCGDHLCCFHCL